MSRKSPNAGFTGRTQQAGTALAATMMPITFQRTLMPKSDTDQAVITGLSTALNYGFAALIQDTIEAVALRLSGRDLGGRGQPEHLAASEHRGRPGGHRARARRADASTAQQPGERIPEGRRPHRRRGGSPRPACPARSSASRRSRCAVGAGPEDRSMPVALPVGGRARGRERVPAPPVGGRRHGSLRQRGHGASRRSSRSGWGWASRAALNAVGVGERLFASGVSRVLAGVAGADRNERQFRPVGHAAALSVIGVAHLRADPARRPADRAGGGDASRGGSTRRRRRPRERRARAASCRGTASAGRAAGTCRPPCPPS